MWMKATYTFVNSQWNLGLNSCKTTSTIKSMQWTFNPSLVKPISIVNFHSRLTVTDSIYKATEKNYTLFHPKMVHMQFFFNYARLVTNSPNYYPKETKNFNECYSATSITWLHAILTRRPGHVQTLTMDFHVGQTAAKISTKYLINTDYILMQQSVNNSDSTEQWHY